MLLQHGADPNIRNTDGKSALDLADPSAKAVLTGEKCEAIGLFCVYQEVPIKLWQTSLFRYNARTEKVCMVCFLHWFSVQQ